MPLAQRCPLVWGRRSRALPCDPGERSYHAARAPASFRCFVLLEIRLRYLSPIAPALILVTVALLLPSGALDAKPSDWLEKLSSNDPSQVYLTTVEIARRRDIAGALPLIETGAATAFPHLAVACGEALAQLRDDEIKKDLLKDKAFKKRFKRLMGNKDERIQKNLARVLGAWGHPFVDEHLAYLASGRRNADVQAEALFMCGSIVETKKESFAKTCAVIGKAIKKGRTSEIQCAACSAAGRRKLGQFKEQLDSLIRLSKDRYAGLFGVWALQQIGWNGGIGSYVHVATNNPKRTTFQANLKAITELSTLKDVDDLLSLTKNSKKDIRDAATLALGRLPWRVWHHKKAAERKARETVVTGAKKAPAPVHVGLPAPEIEVPGKVIDRLIVLVQKERTWEVRDAARQGLIRFGTHAAAKVRKALPATTKSGDRDAQLTSIELCGLFGAEGAYDQLLKYALHADPRKQRALRMFAARALEGIKPQQAVKDLTAGIKKRKKAKVFETNAIRSLGYIRHEDAYTFLVGMFKDQDKYSSVILRQAEYALERLTAHRFGRKPARWAAWRATSKQPFHPRVKEFDRKKNRREAIEKHLYGLTPETESCVEKGLRWLELQQHPMGSWDGNEKGFGGVIGCEPAYTGLSLLALVGAGYNGASGKYRETIRRATEFLAATQFYDGGFPVTGGGDSSWIFAYLIGMGIWGITESYGLSGDETFAAPAQWGIDYLVRVQTPGAGWRYGPRYYQSDTSCTSWVLMTTKMADLIGLDVAQRSWDGIDDWLERCAFDITGEEEIPKDLATDYDYEVGSRRHYQAFTGYLALSGAEKTALQKTSMTAVGMVCRFFMGWKRSHPFLIGSGNYLKGCLPRWMVGLEKGMAIAWYHYYWYYGTLAMHQMGGSYWKAWNRKIKKMYPAKQRRSPEKLAGSWDPGTAVLNGGRLFSTAMSILVLETYYRFSPLMIEGGDEEKDKAEDGGQGAKDGEAPKKK